MAHTATASSWVESSSEIEGAASTEHEEATSIALRFFGIAPLELLDATARAMPEHESLEVQSRVVWSMKNMLACMSYRYRFLEQVDEVCGLNEKQG